MRLKTKLKIVSALLTISLLVNVIPVRAAAQELFVTSLYIDTPPVSYWRMENNSNDTQGNNNGTDTNITYQEGVFGSASKFNGTSSKINTSLTNIPVGASARTINFWMKTTSTNEQVLLAYGTNAATQMIDIEYYLTKIFMNNGTGIDLQGTVTINQDTWYMITLTYDGTTVKLYVNGELDAQNDQALTTGSTFGVSMGWEGYGAGSSFLRGALDDVAIWDTALSSTTIKQLYDGTLPPVASGAVEGVDIINF